MILISHRANLAGPSPSRENHPKGIEAVLYQGISCEVDVWYKNGWFLGHNEPRYKVSRKWLRNNSYGCWYHAKNLDALSRLMSDGLICEVFWHQGDDYTLTKGGFIWTLPNKVVCRESILVVKGRPTKEYDCFGVCTDYVL